MDETTIPVLDPGRGKTMTDYLWAMARDDRPWCGGDPPGVVFTYASGRAPAAHAERLLTGFEAIRYILKSWEPLCVFLEDGRVKLDSNRVENLIRPHALPCKNALFAVHDEGAEA